MNVLDLYTTYTEQSNENDTTGYNGYTELDEEYGETIVWKPTDDGGYHGDYTEHIDEG